MRNTKNKRGFTLAETITVVAVIGILSTITYSVFVNLNQSKALQKENTALLLLLAQARSFTLSSKDSSQYGVHLATSSATLFKGSTYSVSDSSNITVTLSSLVQISTISLAGGGANVIFDRLTGKTSQNGSITLSLVSASSTSKTITVFKTGLTE